MPSEPRPTFKVSPRAQRDFKMIGPHSHQSFSERDACPECVAAIVAAQAEPETWDEAHVWPAGWEERYKAAVESREPLPTLTDLRRMSPSQANEFLTSLGVDWRVADSHSGVPVEGLTPEEWEYVIGALRDDGASKLALKLSKALAVAPREASALTRSDHPGGVIFAPREASEPLEPGLLLKLLGAVRGMFAFYEMDTAPDSDLGVPERAIRDIVQEIDAGRAPREAKTHGERE